jgi:hypothetical protein
MFADTQTQLTIAPSGNWADPASWTSLVKEIGAGGFFGLVILLGVVLVGAYAARRVFGPNGLAERMWIRFDAFLSSVESNSKTTQQTLQSHLNNCSQIHAPSGVGNVDDLRCAGHAFAEMGRKFSEKLGVDVTPQIDRVHACLSRPGAASP